LGAAERQRFIVPPVDHQKPSPDLHHEYVDWDGDWWNKADPSEVKKVLEQEYSDPGESDPEESRSYWKNEYSSEHKDATWWNPPKNDKLVPEIRPATPEILAYKIPEPSSSSGHWGQYQPVEEQRGRDWSRRYDGTESSRKERLQERVWDFHTWDQDAVDRGQEQEHFLRAPAEAPKREAPEAVPEEPAAEKEPAASAPPPPTPDPPAPPKKREQADWEAELAPGESAHDGPCLSVDVSQALLHKRKAREARDTGLQQQRRREYILHKWEIFTRNIYEKDGKIYFLRKAVKVHLHDIRECVDLLLERGRAEAARSASSARELKICTEKFLASAAECSELRKKLRESKKRLSV
jgi:hypothetical protein